MRLYMNLDIRSLVVQRGAISLFFTGWGDIYLAWDVPFSVAWNDISNTSRSGVCSLVVLTSKLNREWRLPCSGPSRRPQQVCHCINRFPSSVRNAAIAKRARCTLNVCLLLFCENLVIKKTLFSNIMINLFSIWYHIRVYDLVARTRNNRHSHFLHGTNLTL